MRHKFNHILINPNKPDIAKSLSKSVLVDSDDSVGGKDVSRLVETYEQGINSDVKDITENTKKETHVSFQTSSPLKRDREREDSSDRELTIHIPETPIHVRKKRFKQVSLDMSKEIEQEIEHQLEKKAKQTNLTVANVKSILRHVITNEDVLAMVEKSMQTSFSSSADPPDYLTLTRAKTKVLLQSKPEMMWPLTPVKKLPDSEHLVLINDELPEESDDEEYQPNFEDLQSEDETGRQSVVSNMSHTSYASTLNTSIGQFFENFEAERPPSTQPVASANFSCFKTPEENIGQRTRSKLCLSDTPLETIEQAFVPPDITTDMYETNCGDTDWENFLKEFMQPLPSDTKDDDDEADPEYNVLADEEEVDKEELRRDKAVKISRTELRTLMAELFECPDEISSDEEEEQRLQSEITKHIEPEAQPEPAKDFEEQVVGVTASQKLVLQQQMRQHVQLMTQHFLQTYMHPVHHEYAKEMKINLVTLFELGKLKDHSVFNVYNLENAIFLVEEWEKHLSLGKGVCVVKHMEALCKASLKSKPEVMTFHRDLMDTVVHSDVFLYPLLLPERCFRCQPFKQLQFSPSEDHLIAIGLEQFSKYIAENPRWFDRKKNTEKAAVDVMRKYLIPGKTVQQITTRIRAVKCDPNNPIHVYRKTSRPPPTIHYVIPFNSLLTVPPRNRPPEMLPPIWREYVHSKPSSEVVIKQETDESLD